MSTNRQVRFQQLIGALGAMMAGDDGFGAEERPAQPTLSPMRRSILENMATAAWMHTYNSVRVLRASLVEKIMRWNAAVDKQQPSPVAETEIIADIMLMSMMPDAELSLAHSIVHQGGGSVDLRMLKQVKAYCDAQLNGLTSLPPIKNPTSAIEMALKTEAYKAETACRLCEAEYMSREASQLAAKLRAEQRDMENTLDAIEAMPTHTVRVNQNTFELHEFFEDDKYAAEETIETDAKVGTAPASV